MQQLRKRWLVLLFLGLFVAGPIAWYKWTGPVAGADDASVMAIVKQGAFKVTVTTTGELRARKFVQVTGPATAQMANVYQTKISTIVPEGQLVKEGDVIAELDRGPAAAKLADVTLNLQKATAQYTSAMLDSALNLAQAREDMRTAVTKLGSTLALGPPEAFGAFMAAQGAKWSAVAKAANIKLD